MSSKITRARYQSTKTSNNAPAYTQYDSIESFFDAKRAQLLLIATKTHPIHARLRLRDLGCTMTPSRRKPLTPTQAMAEKRARISRTFSTVLDPQWCLRRRQLVEMWNFEVRTGKQWREKEVARKRMEVLVGVYRLREIFGTGEDVEEKVIRI